MTATRRPPRLFQGIAGVRAGRSPLTAREVREDTPAVEHAAVAEPQDAPREASAVAPRGERQVLLRLQRTAGNAAVGRLLARQVATGPDTAKLKADLEAKTAEALTLRTEIDGAIKTAAASLPGLEKEAKKAADAAKRKTDDAALAQTAADAQAKVDAARAAMEPDSGRLTKLTQLRREALALVRSYAAELEKTAQPRRPPPTGRRRRPRSDPTRRPTSRSRAISSSASSAGRSARSSTSSPSRSPRRPTRRRRPTSRPSARR